MCRILFLLIFLGYKNIKVGKDLQDQQVQPLTDQHPVN